ncbi:hypothetical protein ACJX0J_040019, partial [Zea mays]
YMYIDAAKCVFCSNKECLSIIIQLFLPLKVTLIAHMHAHLTRIHVFLYHITTISMIECTKHLVINFIFALIGGHEKVALIHTNYTQELPAHMSSDILRLDINSITPCFLILNREHRGVAENHFSA